MEKTQLENVIRIEGKVVSRSDDTVNKEIETAINDFVRLFKLNLGAMGATGTKGANEISKEIGELQHFNQ